MNHHRLLPAAGMIVAAGALLGACTSHPGEHPGPDQPPPSHPHPTHTHPSTSSTSTPGSTIPIDGWAITGQTLNRFCGGPQTPAGCQTPTRPASDTVTVSQGGTTIRTVTSAADGTFRVPVGPGTYTVTASTRVTGASATCTSETITVQGPPIPRALPEPLVCTIQAP